MSIIFLFLVAFEIVISIKIVLSINKVKKLLLDGEKYSGCIVRIIEKLNSENDIYFYPIVRFVDKKGKEREIRINDERYTNSFVIGDEFHFYFNEKVDYALPEGSIWIKWWPVIQWIIAFLVVSILIIAYLLS